MAMAMSLGAPRAALVRGVLLFPGKQLGGILLSAICSAPRMRAFFVAGRSSIFEDGSIT
jgi:hypothetical protein